MYPGTGRQQNHIVDYFTIFYLLPSPPHPIYTFSIPRPITHRTISILLIWVFVKNCTGKGFPLYQSLPLSSGARLSTPNSRFKHATSILNPYRIPHLPLVSSSNPARVFTIETFSRKHSRIFEKRGFGDIYVELSVGQGFKHQGWRGLEGSWKIGWKGENAIRSGNRMGWSVIGGRMVGS